MSKSRLEKFLYALYSLDSSDLPKPLSRIEELYSCLVIGDEVPIFEPLSRVEKYLMAILGVYDVDSLPNPISRVEVLLYKLAIGDDNLDDVKSFLSEHEELLAEIIRNGGVGGNIDIEYVLHTLSTEFNTLYNTAEKPVKSAVLKGQTLLNVEDYAHSSSWAAVEDGDYFILTASGNWVNAFTYNNSKVKSSTDYLIIVDVAENTIESSGNYALQLCTNEINNLKSVWPYKENNTTVVPLGFTGQLRFVRTTLDDVASKSILQRAFLDAKATSGHIKYRYMIIEYQEGMENWDIPYFEGMQSVENPVMTTTGKNLFDPKYKNPDNYIDRGVYYSMPIDLIEGKEYKISFNVDCDIAGCYFTFSSKPQPVDVGAVYFHIIDNGSINKWYYVANKTNYICFYSGANDKFSSLSNLLLSLNNVQLEEGSVATEYEPYKSTTVTCNEDVELHGVGEVKDELNLLTGELTQRIGEIVLDGSEGWTKYNDVDGFETYGYFIYFKGTYNGILCNRFKEASNKNIQPNYPTTKDEEAICIEGDYIKLRINNIASIENFKQYLSQNPITIQYKLATESVKTVDLSVVNQDGNNTKLSTFNDITHVTLSSEGLIPEADLEVATKNEEVLNSMSLRMDDISTTQNALQETSNAQSENVDATMITTTEIYEELL